MERLLKRKSVVSLIKKKSLSKRDDTKAPPLIEMLRKDKELANFFRFVKENDLRKKAHALLESRISLH